MNCVIPNSWQPKHAECTLKTCVLDISPKSKLLLHSPRYPHSRKDEVDTKFQVLFPLHPWAHRQLWTTVQPAT